jgi:putative heme iron utilization protein
VELVAQQQEQTTKLITAEMAEPVVLAVVAAAAEAREIALWEEMEAGGRVMKVVLAEQIMEEMAAMGQTRC